MTDNTTTYSLLKLSEVTDVPYSTLAGWAKTFKEFLPKDSSKRFASDAVKIVNGIKTMKANNESTDSIMAKLREHVDIVVEKSDDQAAEVSIDEALKTIEAYNSELQNIFDERDAIIADVEDRIADLQVRITDLQEKKQALKNVVKRSLDNL